MTWSRKLTGAGTLVDLADAVVQSINAQFADYASATVARKLDTELELEDADTLHIDIVPGSVKSESGTRESQRGEYTLDIAIRKKFLIVDDTQVDELFLLMENIDSYLFHQQRPTYMPSAAWLSSNMRYPYVPEHLHGALQYTGILSVTYVLFV